MPEKFKAMGGLNNKYFTIQFLTRQNNTTFWSANMVSVNCNEYSVSNEMKSHIRWMLYEVLTVIHLQYMAQ